MEITYPACIKSCQEKCYQRNWEENKDHISLLLGWLTYKKRVTKRWIGIKVRLTDYFVTDFYEIDLKKLF